MPKLTKTLVEAIEPEERKDVVLFDSGTGAATGFGIRVKPTGVRSYIIQYRTRAGRSRRYTIGRHGRWTVDKARDEAKQLLAEVDRGGDPAADRRATREAPTMKELRDRYMRDHAKPKKKPSSIRSDRQLWDNHVMPALGALKVEQVTRQDVEKLHARVGKQAPGAANRAVALLSKAFNLAERWGWRSDGSNPTRHVDRFRERKVERHLSPEEYQRLGKAMREEEAEGKRLASVFLAIRLLALTGCRLGEILSLRWDEVDLRRGVLRFSESKTGSKDVVLSAPALELLAKAKKKAKLSEWVIPGKNPRGHLVNLSKPWYSIRARAGLEDVRLHDLRHSFASVGAGAGEGLPLLGRLLGHKAPATTARYAHLADDPARAAADRIGSEIAGALAGRSEGRGRPSDQAPGRHRARRRRASRARRSVDRVLRGARDR